MTSKISFSIIIPTYNRSGYLEKCLSAISRLDYPRDLFEVIVVDDGSEVALAKSIAPFSEAVDLTLISQINAGPAAARNNGARHAKYDYLFFTDDDCTLAADCLQVLEKLIKKGFQAIVGRTVNKLKRNRYAQASQDLVDYLYQYYNSESTQALFFTSNNLMLTGDQFRQAGQFDESFPMAAAEDRDLCDRLQQIDTKVLFDPNVIVCHAHGMNLAGFCRQHFNYGRGAYRFYRKRRARNGTGMRMEPIAFYVMMALFPIRLSSQKMATLTLFLVAQVANTLGFITEFSKRRL